KYQLCSECGGGGKSRTGKWRPRELFEQSRKTCSLPHIRAGDALAQYRVLETPLELSQEVLGGVRDVFFDCHLSLYAVPTVLESPEGLARYGGSVSRLRAEVDALWGTVLDTIASASPAGLPGKLYLSVAWIDKRNRNRGKKKPPAVAAARDRPKVPWLMRLALEGSVAPMRPLPDMAAIAAGSSARSEPSSSSPTMLGGGATADGEEAEDRVYMAFLAAEWDRAGGALFMVQMAPRSVYQPTGETYVELVRRVLERVRADVRRDEGARPLEHLWCWTRNQAHARLRSVPERLGFVPVERYCREHPDCDRDVFQRPGYLPLADPDVAVFATSVHDFLKLAGKGSRLGIIKSE
ncbi:hypothetical protein HK405_016006, partial [Cladochytrium tenue]